MSSQPIVLIPAAGNGVRFSEAGHTLPKPLISVLGQPMLGLVLQATRNIGPAIVLLQSDVVDQYDLESFVRQWHSTASVIRVDGHTEGAVSTCLLARNLIDRDVELFINVVDGYCDIDLMHFINAMRENNADAGIMTTTADNPARAYVQTDGRRIVRVAEKQQISNEAVLFYYCRRGSDFVRYADQMIAQNRRVNGEFYIAPVMNELIDAGKEVFAWNVHPDTVHEYGTAQELADYSQRMLNRGGWREDHTAHTWL